MGDGAKLLRHTHTHTHKSLTSCLQMFGSGVPLSDFVSGVHLFYQTMFGAGLVAAFSFEIALRCILFGSFPLLMLLAAFSFC